MIFVLLKLYESVNRTTLQPGSKSFLPPDGGILRYWEDCFAAPLLQAHIRGGLPYDPQFTIFYSDSTHATRIFNLDQNLSVKLTLIDSLGSSLGRQRVNVKLPACDAILLVYDITK